MQPGKNQILLFLIITTAIILLLTVLIVTLIYIYKKKQLAYAQDLDKMKLEYEKSLMATQLEIQENTLQNISREIHDNINLSLTLAKLNLNTINFFDVAKTRSSISSSIELISESIENLRDISKSLSSDILSTHGLIIALEKEITRIRATGIFSIDFKLGGEPVYLDIKKELIIFRIVQEAFNNIIKHAKASHANLSLDYGLEKLTMTISDNGVGFESLESQPEKSKSGLNNMRTRIKMIEGCMGIQNGQHVGTILKFEIPYNYGRKKSNHQGGIGR